MSTTIYTKYSARHTIANGWYALFTGKQRNGRWNNAMINWMKKSSVPVIPHPSCHKRAWVLHPTGRTTACQHLFQHIIGMGPKGINMPSCQRNYPSRLQTLNRGTRVLSTLERTCSENVPYRVCFGGENICKEINVSYLQVDSSMTLFFGQPIQLDPCDTIAHSVCFVPHGNTLGQQ